MDPFGYPSELMTGFALVGILVVFIVLQILGGVFQAIGTDLWERFKKKK